MAAKIPVDHLHVERCVHTHVIFDCCQLWSKLCALNTPLRSLILCNDSTSPKRGAHLLKYINKIPVRSKPIKSLLFCESRNIKKNNQQLIFFADAPYDTHSRTLSIVLRIPFQSFSNGAVASHFFRFNTFEGIMSLSLSGSVFFRYYGLLTELRTGGFGSCAHYPNQCWHWKFPTYLPFKCSKRCSINGSAATCLFENFEKTKSLAQDIHSGASQFSPVL